MPAETNLQSQLLAALHERHAPALWRFAVGLTRDAHLAEDVVQEALLRAWRDRAVLARDEAACRAWLFTVVRNLVVDDRRSARWRREIVDSDAGPEPIHADHADATLDEWLVTDALAQLSAEHRAVIVYGYYGRHTIAETADRLGIAPGTVKSRLHYGLRALRLALQERGVTKA